MSNTPGNNNTGNSNDEINNISKPTPPATPPANLEPKEPVNPSNTDNSVIKTMRSELNAQKQKLKELESAGETNTLLQTQIKAMEEQISDLNNNLKAEKVAKLSADLDSNFKDLLIKELLNSNDPEALLKDWQETKPNYFAKRNTVQVNPNLSSFDTSKLTTFQKTILSHYK